MLLRLRVLLGLLMATAGCEDPAPVSLEPMVARDGDRVTVLAHGPAGHRFLIHHPDDRRKKAEGTFGADGSAEAVLPLWPLHLDPILEIIDRDDRDNRARQEVRFELDLQWNVDGRWLESPGGGRMQLRAGGLSIIDFPPGTEVRFGDASIRTRSSESLLPLAPTVVLDAMDPAALRPDDRELRTLEGTLRVALPDGQVWEGELPYTGGAARQILGSLLARARAGPVPLPPRTGDAILAVDEASGGATIHGAFGRLSDLGTVAFVEPHRRRAGTCSYEGGVEVPIEVEDHTVTLVDPRTGETLESRAIPFERPARPCPASVPTATAHERVVSGGSSADALERFLEARADAGG